MKVRQTEKINEVFCCRSSCWHKSLYRAFSKELSVEAVADRNGLRKMIRKFLVLSGTLEMIPSKSTEE